MSNSDNLHSKPKVNVPMLSKTPMIIVVVLGTLALLYMVYAMSMNENARFQQKEFAISEGGFNFLTEGSGLARGQSKKEESGIISPTGGSYDANGNYIPHKQNNMGMQNTPTAGRYDANGNYIPNNPNENYIIIAGGDTKAQEREQRLSEEAYYNALKSPLLALKVDNTQETITSNKGQTTSTAPETQMPNLSIPSLTGDVYDPSATKDKEAFFIRASQRDDAWTNQNIRRVGNPFEIKTGAVIPATMITSINSDLPGQVIAQVRQNVFDSATGKELLIPQGARLYGNYDSRVTHGQNRVLVAWNRIIFPDGSAITIPAMTGADLSGTSGFTDKVNNHYMKIFGTSGLMALITAGMSIGIDSASASTSESSMQATMMATLATQIGQTTTKLLEKNMNIQPTLEIRSGYQFNIVVTQDILFQEPYSAWGR